MVQWGTKTARYWESRQEAGSALAERLADYATKDVVVLGLPRGGIVVAAEVAKVLEAPLGVAVVKKVTHPESPEFAIAAVTASGHLASNISAEDRINSDWLDQRIKQAIDEAKRKKRLYLSGRKPVEVEGRTVIIVDDGVATGLTMVAAIQELRLQKPEEVVAAIPVAPEDAASDINDEADSLICLHIEKDFFSSVSNYYERFEQVDDSEVLEKLNEAEDVSGS